MSEKLVCEACKKSFDTKRALNTHHRFHCKQGNESGSSSISSAGSRRQQSLCECPEGGNWRMLNPNNPRHAAAMAKGYKKYCTDCEEVL